MIRATALTKRFGTLKAIEDISFSVERGELCGFLGPNGAGKTTLFKILCGLVSHEGSVTLSTGNKKRIGAIIEKPKLYDYLSMRDNLRLFAGIQHLPMSGKERESLLQKVGLPLERKDPVRNFSMGMKQRLGIAIALLGKPEILILDEPFSGLDPGGVREFGKLIRALVRNDGLTVLLSSHLTGEIELLCKRMIVLRDGRIIYDGSSVITDENTAQLYRITLSKIPGTAVLEKFNLSSTGNRLSGRLTPRQATDLLKALVSDGNIVYSFQPAEAAERFFGNI